DEIGMGDNIWLNDRDAVRTPMQWSPDRNAGFSLADPGRLRLPVNMDAVYGYQSVNVEAQTKTPASLLHWTRRMLAVRRAHPAFGLGTYRELATSNDKVLAYVREHMAEDGTRDTVICVNNLAASPQPVSLRLPAAPGTTPVELTGGTLFPPVDDTHYRLTLSGHGTYWLALPSEEDR
ncbi:DUF3459 domain-containing protein, partial [Streptomyces sp. SID1328]|uniref:alpha-glucosidase C-terminal domain-containing protein n=1 Tax=Streptomyces sp. SID1328 TaxID=2690250 RepID=UPI00136B6FE5